MRTESAESTESAQSAREALSWYNKFATAPLATRPTKPRAKPAQILRDEPIVRVSCAAAAANHGLAATAEAFLVSYCLATHLFTGEELRLEATASAVSMPADPRTWGSILRSASKRGLIRKAGYLEATQGQSRRRPVRLWESMIFKRSEKLVADMRRRAQVDRAIGS